MTSQAEKLVDMMRYIMNHNYNPVRNQVIEVKRLLR